MMNRLLFLFVFFISLSVNAQFSVLATPEPETKIDWAMLYRIENGKGVYVSNSEITDGTIRFDLKNDMPPGIYRILYQAKDRQFLDFIFNKEDIRFTFDPEKPTETIQFSNSDENKLYQEYYRNISKAQKKLDSIQVAFFKTKDNELIKLYANRLKEVKQIQEKFENLSKGKLAYHFIKASRQYNPDRPFESPEAYINAVRDHFFDAVDFTDAVLMNSPMVSDKLIDYVFYLNQAKTPEKSEILHKFAINRVSELLKGNYPHLKNFYESLIRGYLSENNPKMARTVFENDYLKLPASYIDPAFRNYVRGELKTAVGTKAPDIKWDENGREKSLYKLTDKEYYIIVFFSTGCSHCQEQMPKFYDFIKGINNIQVITIGMEDEKDWWEDMTKDWKSFINLIDLKKWDSKWVKDYGVTATPSYFILDNDKVILAKPDDLDELKALFGAK